MRHRRKVAKLGRETSHRQAMLSNLVTNLIIHEKIQTTLPKAKEARRIAERMITFAKRGDLTARRQVMRRIKRKEAVLKLFDMLAARYQNRNGGYTRVVKLNSRLGDNAPMALLCLLDQDKKEVSDKGKKDRAHKKTESAGAKASHTKSGAKKKEGKDKE